MIEREVKISTKHGDMPTFFASPFESEPLSVVIIYMDIWGIREELRQIARHVAQLGYCCALPDLFYRHGRIRHDFRDANGRMITLEKLSEEEKARVRAPLRDLSDLMVMQDTEALLQFARIEKWTSAGPAGVIGYCMGGRYALVAAGTFPDQVRAAACLHGTNLVTDGLDSPHRIAANAKGEIYCGFAERDRFASPAVVQALEEELQKAGVNFHFEIHSGIDHGYALPDRDLYDATATGRDWQMIIAMLRRQLRVESNISGEMNEEAFTHLGSP
jgi:carboxymethylenebutenolidase